MDNFYYNGEISRLVEILKNKLYFGVLAGNATKLLRNTNDTLYFNVDEEFTYTNFYYDFGPLNISCLYKYCYKLNGYMNATQGFKRIIHYTCGDPHKRANSAYLIGSYAIIYLKMDPRNVYKILLKSGGRFKDFLDASQGISQYSISLLDTFQAILKAATFKFFDFSDFNVLEYDAHDKLHNGDMNWIVPRKFLALIGPTDCNDALNGHSPSFYVSYFLKNDVKTVIRLNNKLYNSEVFRKAGIDHIDLFFPDGTTPPKEILTKFLQISETTPCALAVHCKAGLGRTGSLIGAYVMKHYRFTAREAIAWMRVCRPGSVIGQQQGWLEKIEGWLWREGRQYRCHYYGDGDKIPRHQYGIYSIEWPKERQIRLRKSQAKSADSNIRKKISATDKDTPQPPIARRPRHHDSDNKRHQQQNSICSSDKENEWKRLSKIISRSKMLMVNDLRNASTTTRRSGGKDAGGGVGGGGSSDRRSIGFLDGDLLSERSENGNSEFVSFWNNTGQVLLSAKARNLKAKAEGVADERESLKKAVEKLSPKMVDFERTQGDLLNMIKLRRQLNVKKSKV